jgi:Nucleoside transporter
VPGEAAAAPAGPVPPPALQAGEFSLTTPLLAAAEGEADGGEDPLAVAAEEGLDDEAVIAEEERRSSTQSAAELRVQLRLHYASSLLTFLVSLAVFPGLTAFLRPANAQLAEPLESVAYAGRVQLPGLSFRGNLLVPATFVVFGAGDVLGRLLAGVLPRLGARPLFALCVARAALVPMLLSCHMVPPSKRWAIARGAFAGDDTSPFVLLSVLAISNGYAFTVAFAAGPDCVPAGERGRVAQTLVACLVSGVVLGSVCSLLLSVAMQHK